MSEENVEKLRPVYREWARGNLRAGRELFAPDVRYEAEAPGQGPVIGAEAIENQMREFLAQWSEFRIEAEAFEEFGDAVLVTERQHGVGKGSGVETEQTFYAVWVFRDGSVVGVRWDTSRKRAFEAAGLLD
jgi:ketosteroid isomerase-like protein